MKNWDDLRVFLSIARVGTLAAAARLLAIDVTTVSRRLARLEATMGTRLFEMIGGERRLSETGHALLLHAETIEAAIVSVTEGDRSGSVAGHVRLSLAEGLATHLVAPAVPGFRADHPNIRLDLITASGFLNPSKREADVAVMLARPRNRQLHAVKLADYVLRLYATEAYLSAHSTPDSAAELIAHSLISYVPEHIHAVELDYLSEIHDGLVARSRSTSINVQHAMIRSGTGIGILPEFIARRDRSLIGVLPGIALGRSFWLITHEDTHGTPRIQAVTGWLREVAAGIA